MSLLLYMNLLKMKSNWFSKVGEMESDEVLFSVFVEEGKELFSVSIFTDLVSGKSEVVMGSEFYQDSEVFCLDDVYVYIKYKTVNEKVSFVFILLLFNVSKMIEKVKSKSSFYDSSKIGYFFTDESLVKIVIGGDGLLNEAEISVFREMVSVSGSVFSFVFLEIGCVDFSLVVFMIIFIVLYILWDLKSLSVFYVMFLKVIELLKEKIEVSILESFNVSCFNYWLIIKKKNGNFWFIQDMQSLNKVLVLSLMSLLSSLLVGLCIRLVICISVMISFSWQSGIVMLLLCLFYLEY